MTPTLIAAVLAITCALLFYTVGVFGERRAGSLRRKDVILFWIGFACDTTGTLLMNQIAASGLMQKPAWTTALHGVTGAAAILLMLFHACWATYVVLRGKDTLKKGFHRFSIIVWAVWLIPYILGAVLGMM